MQGMQGRSRRHKRQQGQQSLTSLQERVQSESDVERGRPGYFTREERFYRRKLNESIDDHLSRMLSEAYVERHIATEWWRRLARVLATPSIQEHPIDKWEYKLIMDSAKRASGISVHDILRGIQVHRSSPDYKPPLTKEQAAKRDSELREERLKEMRAQPQAIKRAIKLQRANQNKRGSGFIIHMGD